MPVTLPSAYGGLNRGLSQGFGMMNLIDRTKMQKEEVAQQAQYRNEMLALKKSEIERTAKYQEYAKWADNTKTFLGNIKDKPYTVQIQGLNRYISSIPDSLPNLKKSLQGVNLVDKAALQEEIKTSGDTIKALREGTPEALFSVSANHVGTKGADLAFNMATKMKNENKASKLKTALLEQSQLPSDSPDRKRYDTYIQNLITGGGAKPTSDNYLLPDNTIVRSSDKGRTYIGSDGENHPLPYNAMKISAAITGSELSMIKAKKQAKGEIEGTPPTTTQKKDIKEIAEGGTGPYAKMKAAFDRVAGGALGGITDIFPDTQENRQTLRTIRQLGKSALMNSSRGAIWEQERIDELFPDPETFFANPKTEAQKVDTLKNILKTERRFNNKAIAAGTTPKEVSKLRQSNIEIDRLLSVIGNEKTLPLPKGLSEEDVKYNMEKYRKSWNEVVRKFNKRGK